MNQAVRWLGDGSALLGIVLCAVAGLVRVGGSYSLMNMDAITVFIGGVGLMVFACLAKLHLIQTGGS